MAIPWPALISAGSSLLGGLFGSNATKDANKLAHQRQEAANRTAIALRDEDYKRQKEFAQSGIQWRAADAKAAGIHPLYALGATGSSYSPSPTSIGTAPVAADTSMGTAVASMGQDISRAMHSTRSATQRDEAFNQTVQALTVQKLGLENDLLASQVKRMQVNSNPPLPGLLSSLPGDAPLPPIPEDTKQDARPAMQLGGLRIVTDPKTSNMDVISQRYGDEGLASILGPLIVGWNDLMATSGGRPFQWFDRQTDMGLGGVAPSPSQIRSGMKSWYPR